MKINKKILKAVNICACKALCPTINRVLVEQKNGLRKFVATDGIKLVLYTVKTQEKNNEKVFVCSDAIDKLPPVEDMGYKNKIIATPESLNDAFEGIVVKNINSSDVKYPDYKSVIPKEDKEVKMRIKFNINNLIGALQTLSALGHNNTEFVLFSGEKPALLHGNKLTLGETKIVIMPLKLGGGRNENN